jgi:hypothetical protein
MATATDLPWSVLHLVLVVPVLSACDLPVVVSVESLSYFFDGGGAGGGAGLNAGGAAGVTPFSAFVDGAVVLSPIFNPP